MVRCCQYRSGICQIGAGFMQAAGRMTAIAGVITLGTTLIASGVGKVSREVQKGLNMIERSGARVKVNPKAPNQEGNLTLDFGGGSRVNIRVESHPLKPGGPPVRHANIESVTEVGRKKIIDNRHITE